MKLSMSGIGVAGDGAIDINTLTSSWTDGGPCAYVGACQGSQVMDPCSGICHEPNAGDYGDLEKAYQGVLNQLGIGSGDGSGTPSATKTIPSWAWVAVGGFAIIMAMKQGR